MEEKFENGVRVFVMDTTTPLDMKSCLRTFQKKEYYFRLLPNFENSGLMENLYKIAFCVQVGNFFEIKEKAHAIKGAAAYAGASRVSNDCYWIQVFFEQEKYVKMMEQYMQLIPHCIEFRVHWRKQYTVEPEHETVPIPHGYRVVKEAEETFKFIPPDDYLDLALEAEAKGKRYIKHLGDNYSIVYVNEGPLEESRSMITANNYQNNNGSRFDLLSNSYTIYKSFCDHSYADEEDKLEENKEEKYYLPCTETLMKYKSDKNAFELNKARPQLK